jgi:hypothetical protein
MSKGIRIFRVITYLQYMNATMADTAKTTDVQNMPSSLLMSTPITNPASITTTIEKYNTKKVAQKTPTIAKNVQNQRTSIERLII